MTIADVLNAELKAAAADVERGCDRAADAATEYIARRLQQLERRFHRHKFTYAYRRGCKGLHFYPQVCRTNSVAALVSVLCGRSTRWETMRRLHCVATDIEQLAFRIDDEFGRLLGLIEAQGTTQRRFVVVGAGGDGSKAYDGLLADRTANDQRRYNRPTTTGSRRAL